MQSVESFGPTMHLTQQVPGQIDKKRNIWTDHEMHALREAVGLYGTGKWTSIKRDPRFKQIFMERQPGDLRSKWKRFDCKLRKLTEGSDSMLSLFERADAMEKRVESLHRMLPQFQHVTNKSLDDELDMHEAYTSLVVCKRLLLSTTPCLSGADATNAVNTIVKSIDVITSIFARTTAADNLCRNT